MRFRHRFTHLMRSMLPRQPSTRELLRQRRLVAALFEPLGAGEGPRTIADEAELDQLAAALREATRIGKFATLYLEEAANPMTLEFLGKAIRTIRVGRPAERLESSAILVEMDGSVFVAPGRDLGFLFAPLPEPEAVP